MSGGNPFTMPHATWAEMFLEVVDRREAILEGKTTERSHGSTVGVAARVAAGGKIGHAATPGCDGDKAAFCLDRATAKAGLTLPRKWVKEVVSQSDALGKGMASRMPSLDAAEKRILDCLTQIREASRLMPSGVKVQAQGFVDEQAVSIVRRNCAQTCSSDVRSHWGVAVDVFAPAVGGTVRWLERSRGGAGPPDAVELQSLVREVEGLAAQTDSARHARSLRPGRYDVVFLPECASLFFHEVVGHFCEESAFVASGKTPVLGREVAPDALHVDDDATFNPLFGSRRIDDMGYASRRVPLIARGRVSGLLFQEVRDAPSYIPAAPCSVRQDFRHPPLARMSNLIVGPGAGAAQDFVAETRSGILVTKLIEGSIDAHTGGCVLVAAEASLIRKGTAQAPLRPFVIEGSGAEMLRSVRALGADVAAVASYCTGRGGLVPVGGLAPSCVVSSLKARPLE